MRMVWGLVRVSCPVKEGEELQAAGVACCSPPHLEVVPCFVVFKFYVQALLNADLRGTTHHRRGGRNPCQQCAASDRHT